jgi:hypothetical protein
MISVPISHGELLDKISILEIKKSKIDNVDKLVNVEKELQILSSLIPETLKSDVVQNLYEQLFNINLMLWEVEDDIRNCERSDDYGSYFIELARKVYRYNDKRSELKKTINLATSSGIVEEKSYSQY